MHVRFSVLRATRGAQRIERRSVGTNRVLDALSHDDRRRLEPYLERVRLASGRILYERGDAIRHALFPIDGVFSLLALTASGNAAEVAMVGKDGVVGVPLALPPGTAPYQILVHIAADAYRLRADVFLSEFRRAGSLQTAVLAHLHDLLAQMAQLSACHRYHTAQQRLCRWLLMSEDLVHADTIELTQEFIGHLLGADRKRVSAAAALLQDAGVIRQRHGQIKILNRRGLERWSCECYEIVRQRPGPIVTSARPEDSLHHRPARL
jgi:CRP-like cAMP-binding protein